MKDSIEIGDLVCVNINCAQMTLCRKARVVYKPAATGDSWIFRDLDTDAIHYVSEGCTITKPTTNEQEKIPMTLTKKDLLEGIDEYQAFVDDVYEPQEIEGDPSCAEYVLRNTEIAEKLREIIKGADL